MAITPVNNNESIILDTIKQCPKTNKNELAAMLFELANQRLNETNGAEESFSARVNQHLEDKKMTQAELARKSLVSSGTISRITSNNNHKGAIYQPTANTVMSICVGLDLSPEQSFDMFCCAFPQLSSWIVIILSGMDIDQANKLLHGFGHDLLGNMTEE